MSKQVRNILRIALLFTLLLLPIFYALFSAIDLEYSWLKKSVYFGVVLILLLIPAVFLKARTYFIVEGIFNFFFFPIDIASLYLNKQSTSTAFLNNILHTDIHEAGELLLSMWPLCLAVIALWVLYFVLAIRTENIYLFPRRLRVGVLISLPLLFVVGVITMCVMLMRFHSERALKSTIVDATGLMCMKFYKIYPYNLYLETYDLMHARHTQQKLQKQIDSFHFGIPSHVDTSPSLYVLVIGEAARYDHLGIHGYVRPTTPLLSQQQHLITYDSAFSQANLTGYSVPLILTRATAQDAEIAYKEKSLPEAFHEAGFHCGFFSKQIPSPLTERIMQACDYSVSYAKGIDVEGNYDEEMIDQLRTHHTDYPQFFVLHSLGCHFRYELRYPSSFALFQPTFGKTFSYSMISETNKEQLVNAYDNAILYTDYFLNGLIQYMDSLNCPAVLMYMSDHGESFWDDERKLSLHGSYQISEYEYHVPLLIWYSDEYAALYPSKVQAMQQNKTTPVSSDVVFYSMLDIAGIECIVDSTRSIASSSLLPADTVWVYTGSGAVEPLGIH